MVRGLSVVCSHHHNHIDLDDSPGTDLASAFASMFAMCSLLYEPGVSINTSSSIRPSSSIEDASFAEKLRGHAETSYNFAMNATKAVYPDSVPAAGKAYASNSYGDDLVGDRC